MVQPGRFVLPGLSAPVVPNSKPPLLRTFCALQANEAITSNALTNDGIVPFIFDVLEFFGIIEPCVDRQRASAERPGSPTPGQWCSTDNRDAISGFGTSSRFVSL